jgi:hypothetical protein
MKKLKSLQEKFGSKAERICTLIMSRIVRQEERRTGRADLQPYSLYKDKLGKDIKMTVSTGEELAPDDYIPRYRVLVIGVTIRKDGKVVFHDKNYKVKRYIPGNWERRVLTMAT